MNIANESIMNLIICFILENDEKKTVQFFIPSNFYTKRSVLFLYNKIFKLKCTILILNRSVINKSKMSSTGLLSYNLLSIYFDHRS